MLSVSRVSFGRGYHDPNSFMNNHNERKQTFPKSNKDFFSKEEIAEIKMFRKLENSLIKSNRKAIAAKVKSADMRANISQIAQDELAKAINNGLGRI